MSSRGGLLAYLSSLFGCHVVVLFFKEGYVAMLTG
jgi:hypothetical protein